jgi:hypothetical protein
MRRKVFSASLSCLVLIGWLLVVNLTLPQPSAFAVSMAPPTDRDATMVATKKLCLTPNPLTGECTSTVVDVFPTFGSIITVVVRFLMVASAVMFLGMVLTSGYKLAFKADKEKELQSLRQNLTTGLIGLVVVAAAWWLVIIIATITNTTSVISGTGG